MEARVCTRKFGQLKRPQKSIFAWMLALEGLAMQCNRKRRSLVDDATCHICGRGEEFSYHAVVQCTNDRALRHELRQRLCLPEERVFSDTGPDWLLLLLNSVSPEVKANILMLFWRVWYLRNDATFGKGEASIKGSACFLESYCESLRYANSKAKDVVDHKGKRKLDVGVERKDKPVHKVSVSWSPVKSGWVKVNTDADFIPSSGRASAGVVATDDKGWVLLAAWRVIRSCASPEEAEAEACLWGIRLATECIRQATMMEGDFQNLIKDIRSGQNYRSSIDGIIQEIKGVSRLLRYVNLIASRGGLTGWCTCLLGGCC
jgi:hypothetical protein